MNARALQEQLLALQQQVTALQQALEQSRQENTLLRQRLDAFIRRYYGKKGEHLDAAQMELLLSGLDKSLIVEIEQPAARRSLPRTVNHSQRIRTPDNLEVVRQVIEPELVAADPSQWKRIGQEVARRLDYQPGKFFWQETVRPKYVRIGARQLPPVIAPAPLPAIDHGLAANGLLTQILVAKFCDHLPFYRQEQIFRLRHGVHISRQQMVQWAAQAERLLSAIAHCLKDQVRSSRYVQVDETPIRYQDPDLPGRCGQGYLWTALVPGQCVVYEWHASRAADCLTALLGADYKGKLQCDGYPAFVKDKPGITLFGCMAHLRRGFFQAQDQASKTVGWLLNQIGHLYALESQLRETRAGPALRQAQRQVRSRPILQRLKRAIDKIAPRHLPQSPLGKAITYAQNQWANVQRYIDHGEVHIDNNDIENIIRPTAVGKRNWLFFGSDRAGERNATLYTLIQNCRLQGIDPSAYLKDVLTRVPGMTNQQVQTLTPLNWKKQRQAQRSQAA
jgi:transposase